MTDYLTRWEPGDMVRFAEEQAARIRYVEARIATPSGAIAITNLAYRLSHQVAKLGVRAANLDMLAVAQPMVPTTERHMSVVLAVAILADCETLARDWCTDVMFGYNRPTPALLIAAGYISGLVDLGYKPGHAEGKFLRIATALSGDVEDEG